MFTFIKKRKKGIFWTSLVLLAVFLMVRTRLLPQKDNDFILHEVQYQDIVRSLDEVGTVKQGTESLLSFNQTGRIEQALVSEGEGVKTGQTLFSLDRQSLIVEQERAKEGLRLVKADYQRLLAGSSEEEKRYYQVALNNAETVLKGANQSLDDSRKEKEEVAKKILINRSRIYDDAINLATQSVDTGLNTILFISNIQNRYFTAGTQAYLRVLQAKDRAVFSLLGAEGAGAWGNAFLIRQFGGARGLVREADSSLEIDRALEAAVLALEDIKSALESVDIFGFSSADLTALWAEKTAVNNALTFLSAQQQTISAHWLESQSATEAAERTVRATERQVETAKGGYELALAQWKMKTQPVRPEDEAIHLARIRQAEVEVRLAERRLNESYLRAPFDGIVAEVLKQVGETVQPGQGVARIRPIVPFHIELEIYEGDIGQVQSGQRATIEAVAFPGRPISGQVVFINPASRLINNVVYYPVSILLDQEMPGLKAGLTVDVSIVLEEKKAVLVVPENALLSRNGRSLVSVLIGEEVEEREVVLGMRGEGFQTEIVAGLKAGEQVILR